VFWAIAALYGACGGVIVSALALATDIRAWDEARRRRLRRGNKDLPGLREFTDLHADLLVLLTRVVLGAAAGALFDNEVVAAIGFGAAATPLLSQLVSNPSYEPEAEQSEIDPSSTYKPRHAKSTTGFIPQPRAVPDNSAAPQEGISSA
jgi:hypothetical protein